MTSAFINATLFLISFLGYCLFFTRWFRWKFSTTPFFTTSLLACLLYLFSLAGFLKFAPVALLTLGFILLLLWVIKIIPDLRHKVFSLRDVDYPGVVIFIILFFVFFIISRNLTFFSTDEYSHWGLAVKEMLYYNQLPTEKTALMTVSYPPLPALFQYFVCKIIAPVEQNMYFANGLIFISTAMLLVFPKRAVLSSLAILAYFLISFNLGEEATNVFTLYAEGPQSYLLCGIIIYLLTSTSDQSQAKYYRIIPALICLTLTKETGILLSLSSLLFCIYFVGKVIFYRDGRTPVFKLLLPSAILALCIIMAYASWQLYLKIENVSFDHIFGNQPITLKHHTGAHENISRTSVKEVARFFLMPTATDKTYLVNYAIRFEEQSSFSSLYTKTILGFFILLLGTLTILFKDNEEWKDCSNILILLFITSIAYQACLLFTYRFIMLESEGLKIPGLFRYNYPYLQAMAVVFLWFTAKLLSSISFPSINPKEIGFAFISILLLSTLLYRTPLPTLTSLLFRPEQPSTPKFLRNVFADSIPENSRIFHINLNDKGHFHYQMKYYLFPRVLQNWGWGFRGEHTYPPQSEEEKFAEPDRILITPEDLLRVIHAGEFDYVLISYADNEFCTGFSSIFDIPCQDNRYYLYKVNNGPVLSLVNEK